MTKISKQSLRFKSKKLTSKLSVSKHIRMAICNENCDDDRQLMLPPLSSSEDSLDELSPIEEEGNSTISETSNSKYMSSFLGSSLTTISSDSEVSSYKNLNEEFVTPPDHEFSAHALHTNSDSYQNTIGESSRSRVSRKKGSRNQDLKKQTYSHRNNQHDYTYQKQQHQKFHNESSSQYEPNQVQHSEEARESTIVEVDTEVQLETLFEGITDLIRDHTHDNGNPIDNIGLIQNENINDLFKTIASMKKLNRNKTIAFLMMSFSLVAANLNQAKYIIQSTDRSILFLISIGLLIASTFFQILSKISSITTCGDDDLNFSERVKKLKCLHKFTMVTTIIVVILNLILTGITFAEFLKEI